MPGNSPLTIVIEVSRDEASPTQSELSKQANSPGPIIHRLIITTPRLCPTRQAGCSKGLTALGDVPGASPGQTGMTEERPSTHVQAYEAPLHWKSLLVSGRRMVPAWPFAITDASRG